MRTILIALFAAGAVVAAGAASTKSGKLKTMFKHFGALRHPRPRYPGFYGLPKGHDGSPRAGARGLPFTKKTSSNGGTAPY
jgi:hypothetical protein